MVASAVIGVVGAGVSAYEGHKASSATRDATNAAISEQQQALQQQAQLTQPYRDFGSSAIPMLSGLLGIPTAATGPQPTAGVPAGFAPGATGGGGGYTLGGAGQVGRTLQPGTPQAGVPVPTGAGAPVYSGAAGQGGGAAPSLAGGIAPGLTAAGAVDPRLAALQSTPGYQFALQEGTKSGINAASAQGMGLSGNTLEALTRYGSGLAEQTYQQQVQNLMGAVGIGEQAAAGQAANVGQTAGNVAQLQYQQGQTQAGIDVNTGAAITKSLGGAFGQGVTQHTLAGLQHPSTTPGAPPTYSYDPTAGMNLPGTVGDTTNFEGGLSPGTTYWGPAPGG